ncbi:MAG TPA: tRNA (guanosine(37)-N1)-methyltransferase TrmD [Saprospiraceae bacterium]|nr:tRNA (guanosine(37)-N1)-methyltransferase TrmD [Saprospiraceae bacterium]
MRFDIISAVPDLLQSPFQHSILQRAQDRGLIQVEVHDLKRWGLGKWNQIDDYQYGGGAGMVMMPEPLDTCISELKLQRNYDEIIFLSPDGERLNQQSCNALSLTKNLLLICGHYKGIDERIRALHVTKTISIGDYVLSGGELAAAIVVDSVSRLLPGVLNNESSALEDSHQNDLLAPPIYTRPSTYKGMKVPDILLSGHEEKIRQWREKQAWAKTRRLRPDMIKDVNDEH